VDELQPARAETADTDTAVDELSRMSAELRSTVSRFTY
jgi:hypothetical protein